jgi:hypothetical protein
MKITIPIIYNMACMIFHQGICFYNLFSRFSTFLNSNFQSELKGSMSTVEEGLQYLQNVDRIKLIMSYYLELYKSFK